MPEIWFIRHGECTANVGGATRSPNEAPLTPIGELQAQQVARYLQAVAGRKISRIVTSIAQRAQQTAQPTRVLFPTIRYEQWNVGEFQYLVLPPGEATTSLQRAPLVKTFWERKDPFYRYEYQQEQAESFAGLIGRVKRTLREAQGCEGDKLIVIFSHQQFIQAVRWFLHQEQEVYLDDLESSHVSSFHNLLMTSNVPNTAIVKVPQDSEKPKHWLPIETVHLTESCCP